MHVNQIIERYEAAEAEFRHKVLIININRTATERSSVYEAVRYAWMLDPQKAERAAYVLAVQQGLIIGVFRAEQWLEAIPHNFPGMPEPIPDRYGFVGSEAPEEIAQQYLRRRLPDSMRRRGAANPVRYSF